MLADAHAYRGIVVLKFISIEGSHKMSEDTKNNQPKTLSRRDFLKLSSTAALAGVAAPQLSKLSFPNVLKGAKMEVNLLTWFWQEPGRGDAWRAMIKKFHEFPERHPPERNRVR